MRIYFRAGDPALLHTATREISEVSCSGLPLGMFGGQPFVSGSVQCAPDDLFLLLTDAVLEVTNAEDEECRVPTPGACPGGKVGLMADTTNPESFEEMVDWAYRTLPQKIRDLPDFPGIQVVDEPPADVLQDISNRKKWRRGTELLGLYSGTFRTKRSYNQVNYAPDLIFVFRGPIMRCSKGDLRSEVKRVVWHEVAHWLGYETEEQVKALGL